ncbi:peptidase S8 [Bacillus sp. HMF5848]|nr:peptidase S8 [Bacillus sp. HMF5848]
MPTISSAKVNVVYPNIPNPPKKIDDTKLKTFIVLMNENDATEALTKLIKEKHKSIKVRKTYSTVFDGFSIASTYKDIERIKQLYGEKIKAVYESSTYKQTIDESVPYIGSDAVRHILSPDNEHLTGYGIKVGIIDTGIDYSHPDLHRNYAGGFDFVDQDNDPMESKGVHGPLTMHGTHVAGIIAANGSQRHQGVAPEAEIIAYRTLGPDGYGSSEQVIAAIEQAIKDKVDVLNLSLGNTINGPDWPTSLALDKAVDHGIIAITSSGNSGPNAWTVGSPGTSTKAIVVGASTPPLNIPYITAGLNSKQPIDLQPIMNAADWTLRGTQQVVFAGLGKKEDYTDKQLRGKVALVERGEISFLEKAMHAKEAGAKAIIVYNNVAGELAGGFEVPIDFPAVTVTQEAGQQIMQYLSQGITCHFKKIEDTLALFSSRGPVTHTWAIKPDVLAPGVSINSTVPERKYMSMQGTSMAAPHVAGAAALLKQAHPNWNPHQIKAALMNTAKLLVDENGNVLKPHEQGAGRIQINEAIHTKALIYPSSLTFGMFHHKAPRTQSKLTVTIENVTNQPIKISFNEPENQPAIHWKLPIANHIPAKSKKQFTITADVTPSQLGDGIHAGYIAVEAESQLIHLPYQFVVEEPDYPRVMGFQFQQGMEPATYEYEMYLPRGADEIGIALFNPETSHFVAFLDYATEVPRGLFKKQLSSKELKVPAGVYQSLIFAKKAGKQDAFETYIEIVD